MTIKETKKTIKNDSESNRINDIFGLNIDPYQVRGSILLLPNVERNAKKKRGDRKIAFSYIP